MEEISLAEYIDKHWNNMLKNKFDTSLRPEQNGWYFDVDTNECISFNINI